MSFNIATFLTELFPEGRDIWEHTLPQYLKADQCEYPHCGPHLYTRCNKKLCLHSVDSVNFYCGTHMPDKWPRLERCIHVSIKRRARLQQAVTQQGEGFSKLWMHNELLEIDENGLCKRERIVSKSYKGIVYCKKHEGKRYE